MPIKLKILQKKKINFFCCFFNLKSLLVKRNKKKKTLKERNLNELRKQDNEREREREK